MRVIVLKEAVDGDLNDKDNWKLCFQWCRYIYDDGEIDDGYRFIWRRPNGHLQPARGQARILSIPQAEKLIQMAKDDGWGDLKG